MEKNTKNEGKNTKSTRALLNMETKKLPSDFSSYEEMTKSDHFLFQPPGCLDTDKHR